MPADIVVPEIVRADLQDIAAYVGQGGHALALDWLSYIEHRIDMLRDFPLLGPAYSDRYRKLQARSYWVLYRVDDVQAPTTVTLVRIIHHKQDMQRALRRAPE